MRILLLFLLIPFSLFSQKPGYLFRGFGEDMDVKLLSKWTVKKQQDYSGIYHFGESEGEWDLLVFVNDTSIFAQSRSGHWGMQHYTQQEIWLWKFKTYTNIKLDANGFAGDSLWGYFMSYKWEDGLENGIILLTGKGKMDTAEYGGRLDHTFKKFFDGHYPELSYKVMDDAYFITKSKEQLQLMRNEIFARYGMIFAKNGKAYNHFIKEEWYKPWKKDVGDCLTPIEQKNLEKIKAFESKL